MTATRNYNPCRSSDHYPIREALEICKERHYIEEQVQCSIKSLEIVTE